jgi:hypothetical protein
MTSNDREGQIRHLLYVEKWPVRTMAEQLGLAPTFVRRVLARSELDAGHLWRRPRGAGPGAERPRSAVQGAAAERTMP